MRRSNVLAVISLLWILAGCGPVLLFGAGTAAGVGGYRYYHGALDLLLEVPFMKAWDAALSALEDLGWKVKSAKHDLTSGKIAAKTPDGEPVGLAMSYRSAQETQVVIRVGLFGNKQRSLTLKEHIQSALGGPGKK